MLRKILPHVSIVLCNMYIVFYLIDRVNSAMAFINNSLTKALLLVLCVISTINASYLILDERRKTVARNRRRAEAARSQAQTSRAMPARSTAPARPASRTDWNNRK